MNPLPKLKDFEAPKGYFDKLPQEILNKAKAPKNYSWVRYAAAAVILIGLGITWQLDQSSVLNQPLTSDEEAHLYIESQLWTAEDVLSLSDDPNALLDKIIEEEWTATGPLWPDYEQDWF
jgi:hypothetical protein